jgi:hypothetical protein
MEKSEMHCRYLSSEGRCSGTYDGYACIREQCADLKQARSCEHHDAHGDYCHKYARFGCVGRNSCETLADYLDACSASEPVHPAEG